MKSELREAVSKDERVLALQKTLEQKQQQRQLKKSEKANTKRNEKEPRLGVKKSIHNKVKTERITFFFNFIYMFKM